MWKDTLVRLAYDLLRPLGVRARKEDAAVRESQSKIDASERNADEVLAKHDENYMPPEVAAALEEAGKMGERHPGSKPL